MWEKTEKHGKNTSKIVGGPADLTGSLVFIDVRKGDFPDFSEGY